MLYKTEQALSTALRGGQEHPVWLLHGSENYLIESWARKLCGPADADLFNFQRLDGQKLDFSALYDAVEMLPLGCEQKRVLVDDLDPAALSAADLKELEQLLADPPPSCRLVVTAKAPGFDAKSAAAKKIVKLFDGAGAVAELGARGRSDLVRYLASIAKSHGCNASNDLCRYLIDLCGDEMLLLRGEMEKACAYAGGGELTREQIDAVAVPKTEARVFDLLKCILAGDASRALHLLDALFYLREPALMVLGTLSMGVCDLYRARAARDAGLTLPALCEQLGYKGRLEFRAKRAFGDVGRLSADTLRAMLDRLLACDTALKSSSLDERVLLEQTVLRLIMAAREVR